MKRLLGLTLLAGVACVTRAEIHVPPGFELIKLHGLRDNAMSGALNNRGQVVYMTGSYGIGDDSELYLYEHGNTTRLTNDEIMDRDPAINTAGVIVWTRAIGPPEHGEDYPTGEVMMYRDGEITRLTDNDYEDSGPEINEESQILWTGYMEDGWSTFLYNNGEIKELTSKTRSDWASGLNDRGDVVCCRRITHEDDSWHHAVFLLRDGVEAQLSSDEQFARTTAALDNAGNIWWSESRRGDDILWRWNEGENTKVVENGGGAVANDRGDVGFYRFYSDDQHERGWYEAWLQRNGELLQITDDPSIWGNWIEDINQRGEFVIYSGDIYQSSEYLVRRSGPRGDLNCDGAVDFDDVDGFLEALMGPVEYNRNHPDCDAWYADTDNNGWVEMADIDGFVICLINVGCD